jgi:outer membrane receptor protein involved in Fe transport
MRPVLLRAAPYGAALWSLCVGEAPVFAEFSTRVVADRVPLAASSLTVPAATLFARPVSRPSDLLRVVPGLLVLQHAGGGKANQYLLRGFDADHGTDVALFFDGVPINMVSHGHGQGYADLSFLIPELVERVEIQKGPYSVEQGDFATAGTIQFVSRQKRPGSSVSIALDTLLGVRGVGIGAGTFLNQRLHVLAAVEGFANNGPFLNPENHRRFNVFSKLTYEPTQHTQLSLALASYGATWNASGQLPLRAVQAGQLDRFDSLDPTEGGGSTRHSATLAFSHRTQDLQVTAQAYVLAYTFKLFSNFTFALRDPVAGDQIEQTDDRVVFGAATNVRRRFGWKNLRAETLVGASLRTDRIENALYNGAARVRQATVVQDEVRQTSIAAFVAQEVSFRRLLRVSAGLRTDYFVFDAASRVSPAAGLVGAARVSPKGSVLVRPHAATDFFLNVGTGFHSNDARGVVLPKDAVTPLTAALGYELGGHFRVDNWLDVTLALWGLDLDSELVWIGDEGRTEASGASRRLGAEIAVQVRPTGWLALDADVTSSSAHFRDGSTDGQTNQVPLAPRWTVSAGATAQAPFGLRGALRFFAVTARPATEDGFLIAEAIYQLDLSLAYRHRFVEIAAGVENLLNRENRQAQFATTSRLRHEAATDAPPPPDACPHSTRVARTETGLFAGCEDIGFTPAAPVVARVTVSAFF